MFLSSFKHFILNTLLLWWFEESSSAPPWTYTYNFIITYMNRFQFLIIKDLNLSFLCSKCTPLFKCLILTTQVTCFLVFVVAECCLLVQVIPFYGPVTIACYKLFCGDRFPLETCTWVTCHARGISNVHDFPLINVVNTHLSIWTSSPNELIICTNFQWKNFGVNISEEVYNSGLVFREVLVIEFEQSWTETFLL